MDGLIGLFSGMFIGGLIVLIVLSCLFVSKEDD